jgi:hypothetical protein
MLLVFSAVDIVVHHHFRYLMVFDDFGIAMFESYKYLFFCPFLVF